MHLAADAVAPVTGDDPERASITELGGTGTRFDGMRDVGQPIATTIAAMPA